MRRVIRVYLSGVILVMMSAAETRRRCAISNCGSHDASSISARQSDPTVITPAFRPAIHALRQNPSSLAWVTMAHASSSISRWSVSSHVSSPSGLPPGRLQRTPSGLTRTTMPSPVTQTPAAPSGVPFGGAMGGCQERSQSSCSSLTAISSPSRAGLDLLKGVLLGSTCLLGV
jgi:hypothetical protein